MKLTKSTLSLVVILAIIFGMLPMSALAAEAAEDPVYTMFRASRYSQDFQDIFGDPSNSYAYNFYTSMKQDKSFMKKVAAWEAVHIVTDPVYTLQSGALHKKDLYKVAIFDLLEVNNSVEALENDQLNYVADLAEYIEKHSDLGVTVSEFSSITNVADMTDEMVKAVNTKLVFSSVKDLSILTKILNASLTLHDAVNTVASYQAIADRRDGTREVLTAISQLPDGSLGEYFTPFELSELRLAAYECISYYDNAYTNILERIASATEPYTAATIQIVSDAVIGHAWDLIVNSIPGLREVSMGLKGIRFLGNVAFQLDEKTKAFYQLGAAVAFEAAVRKVMTDASYDYLANSNLTKAKFYMQAVSMYKKAILLGYDYSIDLFELVAGSAGNMLFDWLTYNYSEAIEMIEYLTDEKANKEFYFRRFDELVLKEYRAGYLSGYDHTISQFNNQQVVKITSISLQQVKAIRVGDTGYIGNYINVIKTPANANQAFSPSFHSENEDVIKLDANGFIQSLNPGKCTILCEKGRALEASITVTVEEPAEAPPHDYLSDFTYSVNYNGTATITKYKGSVNHLVIPSTINGYRITSIGQNAFKGCTSLVNVIVPNTVTSIGNYTFSDCNSLTSITIPDGVTSIGGSAFSGCSRLTSITIPDGVTSIGGFTFSGCSSLTSINIPEGVTSIGYYAFSSCSSLASINIPEGVTSIGGSAFYGCSSLTSITIPEGVTSIDSSVFDNCSSLTSITIPDGVTSIGGSAFSGCSRLTSITIPDGVTSIGGFTFSGCSSLTSITIPVRVTSIGSNAFFGCNSLISITIPEGVTSIGSSVFENCSSLTSINIPVGVTSIGSSVFENCSSLISITIPEGVTSIGSSAFKDCSSLISINIPEGVTSIGGSAFYGCSSLTSINIPKSVTSIEDQAFKDCSSLTSITIPEGVTSIGTWAFMCCYSLTSVNILGGVTSIGSSAFNDCSSLTSINIPEGVTSIGSSAFNDCSSLTSITIPESVTSIGSSAFHDCSSLSGITVSENNSAYSSDSRGVLFNKDYTTLLQAPGNISGSYTIPDSVTSIVSYAFYDCSSLTSINIPEGVTSIGDYTFCNCSSLTCITIPEGVTSIGDYAFHDCNIWHVLYTGTEEQWNAINIDTSNSYLKNATHHYGAVGNEISGVVSKEPACLLGTVTAFYCAVCQQTHYISSGQKEEHQYMGGFCTVCGTESVWKYRLREDGCYITTYLGSATAVTIPATIEGVPVCSISTETFKNCTSLTSVIISEGMTSIVNNAFYGCSNLTSITIPDSVSSIGNYAFYDCSSLTSVIIPDGVTSIGGSAFSGCSRLTSISIPESVSSIGNFALHGCSSLTSINIPESVTSIGDYAFYDCSSLTSITIPESVTSIGSSVFENCSSLTSITIPESVASIGDYAFYDCSSLTSINIPEGVTSIGRFAFFRCSSLTSINIPEGVVSIGDSAFSGCSSLTSINIPESMTSIGDYAFYACSSLTSINIPDNVTSIGCYAFRGCWRLATVQIPAGLTSIGDSAFDACFGLWHILYSGTEDEWDEIVIGSNNDYLISATRHCGAVGDEVSGFVYTEPTCTKSGAWTSTCHLCGMVFTQTVYGTALGHSFTDYRFDNNATCTADGTETAKCDRCDATDRRVVPGTASHRYIDGVCCFCDQEYSGQDQAVVSGSITADGEGSVQLILTAVGADAPSATLTTSDGSYSLSVVPGLYTLTVSREGCITRTYTVTLGEGQTSVTVKLHKQGDVTGDGRVNVGDVAKIYAHSKRSTLLTDDYQLLCADYNGDGRINVGDAARVYALIKSK